MKQEGEEKVETQFAFESERWKALDLKTIVLKQMMRQDDTGFQEILNQARWGRLTKESFQILEARQGERWQDLKIKPTLLFSRRAEVEMINERNLSALKGPTQTYHAKTVFDTTCQKDYTEKSPEVVRATTKLDKDAPYKPVLDLKVGTQVMLVYNLDQEQGLVNGSRGVVEGFKEGLPLVLFKGQNQPIPISRQTWESEDLEGVKRSQIPLILAYAVTIHKCQGATLDSALIDIGPSTFEVGQAYVALSRVKSLDSLYIYDVDPLAFKASTKVCRFYEGL
jgi:ATP-dependent DNA helicase PIF1